MKSKSLIKSNTLGLVIMVLIAMIACRLDIQEHRNVRELDYQSEIEIVSKIGDVESKQPSFCYFAFFGLWESVMLTLSSVSISVIFGILVGLLLGILGYRSKIANRILTPLYDLMQSLPVFSYLVPILMLFGFGPVAALIATVNELKAIKPSI